MPIISIIIPMFNSEKTIERCLAPILKTTADVEIVCVDDGSQDTTYKVVDAVSQNDSRVRLIHQENQGASAARNKGISVARAAYVMFCDADDAFDEHVIEQILRDIDEYNSPDIIVFKRANIYPDGHKVPISTRVNRGMIIAANWSDYVNNYMAYMGHSVSVINKVYKRSIINEKNVSFPEDLVLSEDLYFNLCYIPYCVSFMEDYSIEYHRYLQDNSLTRKKMDNYFECETRALRMYGEMHPNENSKIKEFVAHSLCNSALQAIIRYAMNVDGNSIVERWQNIKKIMRLDLFQREACLLKTNMESKSFLRNVMKAQQGKVMWFLFEYRIKYQTKRLIKKILQKRC